MILLGSFWEGLGGFLGFVFAIFVVVFLISLFGRKNSSTEENELFKNIYFGSNRFTYAGYMEDSLGVLSQAAKQIEEKGNADFVLKIYTKIKKKRNGANKQ